MGVRPRSQADQIRAEALKTKEFGAICPEWGVKRRIAPEKKPDCAINAGTLRNEIHGVQGETGMKIIRASAGGETDGFKVGWGAPGPRRKKSAEEPATGA